MYTNIGIYRSFPTQEGLCLNNLACLKLLNFFKKKLWLGTIPLETGLALSNKDMHTQKFYS